MNITKSLAFILTSGMFCISPAMAQEACTKPLQILVHLPMTPVMGTMTVPIGVNGTEKKFLVDTGAVYHQLSSGVADELKLTKLGSKVKLSDSSGNVAKYYAAADVTVGSVKLPKLELMISDLGDFDGVFAPAAFQDLDFDFDFAGGKLNLISKDHCEGKVIYWPAKATTSVPFQADDKRHIVVPVTVDGQSMNAILDTGSSTSTLSADAAHQKFGLTPDSPDMKAVGHVGSDEKAMIYHHPFKTLSFEGITVENPDLQIVTDIMSTSADHGLQLVGSTARRGEKPVVAQMVVGLDILGKLHMYLAQTEKRVYLTDAGGTATK